MSLKAKLCSVTDLSDHQFNTSYLSHRYASLPTNEHTFHRISRPGRQPHLGEPQGTADAAHAQNESTLTHPLTHPLETLVALTLAAGAGASLQRARQSGSLFWMNKPFGSAFIRVWYPLASTPIVAAAADGGRPCRLAYVICSTSRNVYFIPVLSLLQKNA